jgi:hypothetical protein
MVATKARTLFAGALAALLGCVKEYHPEYSPKTSVSYVQNISYVTNEIGSSRDARDTTPEPTEISLPSRPVTGHPSGAPSPAVAAAVPTADAEPHSRADVYTPLPDAIDHRVSAGELAIARARCRAGEAETCRMLPGIHINGNVHLNGNVVMFGDVFMNDAVAASGSLQ